MINRRTALKFGALGAASTLLGQSAYAATLMSPRAQHRVYRSVYDRRFTESIHFGKTLSQRGIQAVATEGDVATLWYKHLKNDLKHSTGAVVGLTDRPTLFCLEELARDLRLKVVFRADHLLDKYGNTIHSFAPDAALHSAATTQQFGNLMANHLLKTDFGATVNAPLQKRTGPNMPAGQTALVTWVIA